MIKKSLIAKKRIQKDIVEILSHPIEGISIAQINQNDIFKYVVNIKLMNNIYEGYCLQLYLTFNENYPTNPPKMLIFPGQEFDGRYHHHIFIDPNDYDGEKGFKKFCFDLLENTFMNTNVEHSGWNPSYSISSILLQVQTFLSDMHDLHVNPSNEQIQFLLNSMKNYKRKFIDETGKEIIHTWDNPYPKFPNLSKDGEKTKINDENDKNKKINEIKENLTCYMLKLNYIDDKDILLGYPIVKKIRSTNIELFPIPELLSYEAYINQIGKNNEKLEKYFNVKFKSASNEYYNYWVPIYIDKYHFEKNKTTILNSFSIIKYGFIGKKEYDFNPNQIFEILPIILNKMIIGILNNEKKCSHAFIQSYFHYILLLKKLIEIYKDDFNKYINFYLNKISKKYYIDKKSIPDIGNFIVLLFFSDMTIPQKIWNCLYKEILVRQIFWIFQNMSISDKEFIKQNNNIINENINESIKKKENEIFLNKFKSPTNFNIRYQNKFIEDCKNEYIYDDIVQLLSNDKNVIFKYLKNKENFIDDIKSQFKKCFKNLYIICSYDTQEQIDNYILYFLSFKDYFKYKLNNNNTYEMKEIKEEINNLYKENFYEYFSKKNKLFFENIYSSQKGNSLLLISFMARKKMKKMKFFENLENNYGVFLEADAFIEEIRKKMNEIKTYTDLYKYIRCSLIKNDVMNSEIELISDAYVEAKEKKYI